MALFSYLRYIEKWSFFLVFITYTNKINTGMECAHKKKVKGKLEPDFWHRIISKIHGSFGTLTRPCSKFLSFSESRLLGLLGTQSLT